MENLETVIYQKKGNVAWITLNRPEALNALNAQLRAELMQALEQARDDLDIHVIAVTGAGDRAFCAGADIGNFLSVSQVDQLNTRYAKSSPYSLVRDIPKPVVAVVNGLALGGGCEIVLGCDIAIASENAQFAQAEIRAGVIPGGGGTQILPRLIGEKRARELIYTGRSITAQEALAMGMINRVVPPDKLMETAEEFIGVLLRRSPVMLKLAKLAINRSLEAGLSAGLAAERDLFTMCFSTEDQKEAARAFFEKRQPEYKGR